jgi:hypothetical protein
MTAAEFELLGDEEVELILCHRLHALKDAGFAWDEALVLATHVEIDLRDARSLLRRGCPPETALRILLAGSDRAAVGVGQA